MSKPPVTPFPGRPTSRRALARGVAWTAPTLVFVAAAPAFAASASLPAPIIGGSVLPGKQCRPGADTLTIDGTGGNNANPPGAGTRGLWVYNTTISIAPVNVRMTFYYPSSVAPITWTAATGNSGWSVPVVTVGVDTAIGGFTAYTTYYTGLWTFYAASGTTPAYSTANGRPQFNGSVTIASCGADVSVYARRTVTVGAATVTTLGGPVSV